MRINRRAEIERFVNERGTASMQDLVKYFNVSLNTIRMDIKYLVEKNVIKKVYGGVAAVNEIAISKFDERNTRMLIEKQAIAKAAATYIHNGDVIFIDSGTTAMHLGEYIDDEVAITVITHNFSFIASVINKENVNVIVLPGVLERKTRSFFDVNTSEFLERYNISKAFLAVTGITEIGNLCNSSSIECDLKKTALHNAEQVYLLADSSKFEKTSLMTFGNLRDVDLLLTDEKMTEAQKQFLELSKLNYIVCKY